jgi:spore maturation protein SpmB
MLKVNGSNVEQTPNEPHVMAKFDEMLEAMTAHGADSLVGRLCCILQGTTDTTFYVLAVYFGSVGIKNTRHAVACCLLADLAGAIAAFVLAGIFFS